MRAWSALHIVALSVRCCCCAAASNLIVNPNFEQTILSNSHLASNWSYVYQAGSVYSRVTDVVRPPATAALKYSNQDAKTYQINVQDMPAAVATAMAGRHFNASAWIKTDNITGADSGATIAVEWTGPGDGRGVPGAVCINQTATGCETYLAGKYLDGVTGTHDWSFISAVVQIPDPVDSVRMDVYVRSGMVGVAWFDTISLVEIPFWAQMKTVLLSPVYRGRIAKVGPAGAGCRTIALRAHLPGLPQRDVSALELVATLSDASGATVETVGGGALQAVVDMYFRVVPDSLSAGNYSITCSLHNATSGAVLHQTVHSVTRVDDNARQPTAWIDEHQRLIYRGKPKFVIGLYMSWIPNDPGDPGWSTPAEDIDRISKSAFNSEQFSHACVACA